MLVRVNSNRCLVLCFAAYYLQLTFLCDQHCLPSLALPRTITSIIAAIVIRDTSPRFPLSIIAIRITAIAIVISPRHLASHHHPQHQHRRRHTISISIFARVIRGNAAAPHCKTGPHCGWPAREPDTPTSLFVADLDPARQNHLLPNTLLTYPAARRKAAAGSSAFARDLWQATPVVSSTSPPMWGAASVRMKISTTPHGLGVHLDRAALHDRGLDRGGRVPRPTASSNSNHQPPTPDTHSVR